MTMLHDTVPAAEQGCLFNMDGSSTTETDDSPVVLANQHESLRSLNKPELIEDIITNLPSDVQVAVRQALDAVLDYINCKSRKAPLKASEKIKRQTDIDNAHRHAVEALSALYGSEAARYWLNVYQNRQAELGSSLAAGEERLNDRDVVAQAIGATATDSGYSDGVMSAAGEYVRSPWNQD